MCSYIEIMLEKHRLLDIHVFLLHPSPLENLQMNLLKVALEKRPVIL